MPKIGTLQIKEGHCRASVEATTRLTSAALHSTSETGPINKRAWTTVNAELGDKSIQSPAPPPTATAWFLTVTNERNLTVSSDVSFGESVAK